MPSAWDIPDSVIDDIFESWLPGAMFPSELMWLAESLRADDLDVLIECGRQDGVSTWTLATLLRETGIEIVSIDFDDDPARLERTRARLAGLPATCVSGDIHVMVPKLLGDFTGRSVAIVQDGPKGWEGLGTLLAAAHNTDVVLIAQHNLHLGHASRRAFEELALRPCFLESAVAEPELPRRLREREQLELAARAPNRPMDHSSLGMIDLDEAARDHLLSALPQLRRAMGPWHPRKVCAHWDRGDFEYCSRVRRRARWTTERFRKR